METIWEYLFLGTVCLITMFFGFWLSDKGKPYNGILFNAHKLIALLGVILIALRAADIYNRVAANRLLAVPIVIAALCILMLFVSGALMSAGKFNQQLEKSIHFISLILMFVSAGAFFYLTV